MATDDAVLFRALRDTWQQIDPVPDDLIDRMIVAVATADLSAEYALLTLVVDTDAVAVRGETDALTLQFTDGTASVLVHVVTDEKNRRRIDGWVDAPATEITLVQDDETWTTTPDHGRFSFEDIPAGMCHVRVLLDRTAEPGASAELRTPRFDV